jgi:hypothetical protein
MVATSGLSLVKIIGTEGEAEAGAKSTVVKGLAFSPAIKDIIGFPCVTVKDAVADVLLYNTLALPSMVAVILAVPRPIMCTLLLIIVATSGLSLVNIIGKEGLEEAAVKSLVLNGLAFKPATNEMTGVAFTTFKVELAVKPGYAEVPATVAVMLAAPTPIKCTLLLMMVATAGLSLVNIMGTAGLVLAGIKSAVVNGLLFKPAINEMIGVAETMFSVMLCVRPVYKLVAAIVAVIFAVPKPTKCTVLLMMVATAGLSLMKIIGKPGLAVAGVKFAAVNGLAFRPAIKEITGIALTTF